MASPTTTPPTDASQAAGPSRRRLAAHLVAIGAVAVLVYANTFDVPMTMDDDPVLSGSGRSVSTALAGCFRDNRCVGAMTFAANRALGGDAVGGYHAVNLAIHVLTAVAVYLLVRLLCRTPRLGATLDSDGWLALAAAVLFAVHPMQTMAVTYIVQRFASLAALFYLVAVVAWVAARLEPRAGRRRALFAVSLAGALLAMKTKENTVTLPLALALIEGACFAGPLRPRLLRLLPWAVLTALPIATRLGGTTGVADGLRADSGLSRVDYALAQLTVIPAYLRLLIVPVGQSIDHQPHTPSTLLHPTPLLGALLLTTLVTVAVRWTRSPSGAGKVRLAGLGVLWFLLTLAVESSVIPIRDVMVEHRLYLPSVGFFLAVVAVGSWWHDRLGDRQPVVARAALALSLVVVVVLARTTWRRNELWRDEIALWREAQAMAPDFWRTNANLGVALLERGQCAEAVRHLETAAQLEPREITPPLNLALCQAKLGQPDRAEALFARLVLLAPGDPRAPLQLGRLLAGRGELDGAKAALESAARADPQSADALTELGAVLAKLGQLGPAARQLERAVTLDPDATMAWNNLANVRSMAGDQAEAIEAWRRALRCDPSNAAARANLARALEEAGQTEEANLVRAGAPRRSD